ncbi:uncharacterized protein LOC111374444 [Olea europaea var. sylvestris]|uniref:uncharacterized protein LOC111374444 n=1 Tax=Olea europaea var. sylvestris TaxID=158386 RepID=UPI000C1D09B0|nr:uncharacterized protein LOC111374444 [Olea europaea var. sylvestris]
MRKCPNHGITQGNQVQYFYTGLTPLSKSQVDASAGGSIIGKSVQQTIDLFELIATTHSMFSSERVVPPKVGGMYELDSTTSTNAQIAALTKQVELLVNLQTHGANAMMASSVCENCGRNHATESCMMLTSSEEQVNFIQNNSRNFNSYGNNFQQERRPSLGEIFQQYVQKTDKIAQQSAERPQGTLPDNTMINPKEQLMAIEITTERPKRKDDQEVIDEVTRIEKSAPDATENREGTETLAAKAPSLNKAYMPPIPFPQKLKKNKQDTNYEKFLDVLKKLQINVPSIDTILQIPSYEKFLREMLTKRRKLPEFETMALTEESSARVQRKLPPELKDPGSFTLSVSIGNSYLSNALKLGLGEVNSTSITLQLADRTITKPRGKVEDIILPVLICVIENMR